MNFYLDFEATQYTNKIISIGCVAENNESFHTYVNPGEKEKISSFITELTGITEEMLKKAPSIDEAFTELYNFVLKCDFTTEPHYFCYGFNDVDFIKESIKDMKQTNNIIFAQSILYALFDYSKAVKKFFNTDQPVALIKLFSFIKADNIVQKHNALEDAQMLKDVADQLHQFCNPEDIEKIRGISKKESAVVSKKKRVSDAYLNLIGSTWKCNTGDAACYKIKCSTKTGKTKYFLTMEVAVMWLIKYICSGSPKDENKVNHCAKCIRKAIKNETKYCGMFWEENKND